MFLIILIISIETLTMRVLITVPTKSGYGGVTNYYLGIKEYWKENIEYFYFGRKPWRNIFYPFLIIRFIIRLICFKPDIVLLNPSLGDKALKRDFIYLNICRFFRKKTSVFIHGFNFEYAKNADWKWISANLNKALCIFVLSQDFKNELIRRGIKSDIHLTSTKVPDYFISGFDLSMRQGKAENIMYSGRIEKAKGVYETVDTFSILKSQYKDLTLTFVGDGSELPMLKQYVENKKIKDVRFTGELRGEDFKKEYINADMYLFLSYTEGKPTVVLEAMIFGLPIFTRKVGGLIDFFENGKMGYISSSLDPAVFAEAMKPYIENPAKMRSVSIYNSEYAKTHFVASVVVRKFENTLKKYIEL